MSGAMRMGRYFVCVLLILLAVVSAEDVIVSTANGLLRGTVETIPGQGKVSRFLGIPYAAPPIGPDRFLPPKTHHNWNGTKDARTFGDSCIQSTKPRVDYPHFNTEFNSNTSEDCLFLNIYVPYNLSLTMPGDQLAVMVWVHGGSYFEGAGSLYHGEYLSLRGGVIVVTINYRLGALGFLSTLSDSAPGNAGLMDQNMALKWIQRNIQYFYGNASMVTIFGESAGAHAVGLQALSPASRGLFIRVISQSGVVTASWGIQSDPVQQVQEVASELNCSHSNESIMIDCLREWPAQELHDIAHAYATNPSDRFNPVVDGDFIPDSPVTLYVQGRVLPVEYITGFNSYEAFMFRFAFIITDDPEGRMDGEMTDTVMRILLQSYAITKYPESKVNLDKMVGALRFQYGPITDEMSLHNAQALEDIFGDLTFVAPSGLLARLHSNLGLKTYSYMFSHASSFRPAKRGADHAEEINFIFGLVSNLVPNTTEEERELGYLMMDGWTDFAKTG